MKEEDERDTVQGRSCWECKYNNLQGTTLFGLCTWFGKHGKGENKEIPVEVADVGCKHFLVREAR